MRGQREASLTRRALLPGAAVAAIAALLALAPPALAATRYASPTGDASNTSCPQGDPCDIQTAVEHGSVADGDLIQVLPGTYMIGDDTIEPSDAVTIQGSAGRTRPKIVADFSGVAGFGLGISLGPASPSIIRDLAVELIEGGAGGRAISAFDTNVFFERLIVTSSDGGMLVEATDGGNSLVRDSIVFGDAGLTTGGPAAPGTGTVRIVNVTAVATGQFANGLFACGGCGQHQAFVENSILLATNQIDVAVDANPENVSVTLSYSNFDGAQADPPNGTVTEGPGNQKLDEPVFEHLQGGGLHQAPTSPTLGAGNGSATNIGTLDVDGGPRNVGGVDIGADERIGWSNDALATPIDLVGSSATESAFTFGASKESGEPNHAGNPGGASLWYRWTPPASGMATIDVCDSDFDTLLGVYVVTAFGFNPVASNDDTAGCGLGGLGSRVTFDATAGVNYLIAVDGFNNGLGYRTGYFTIRAQGQPVAPVPGSGPGGGSGGAAAKPPPSNEFQLGGVERNKTKGIAFLTIIVPGPGQVGLGGPGLKEVGLASAAARKSLAVAGGEVKLKVKPAKKGKRARKIRRALERKGKATVGIEVTYAPAGGAPNTKATKVKLVRKR